MLISDAFFQFHYIPSLYTILSSSFGTFCRDTWRQQKLRTPITRKTEQRSHMAWCSKVPHDKQNFYWKKLISQTKWLQILTQTFIGILRRLHLQASIILQVYMISDITLSSNIWLVTPLYMKQVTKHITM